MYFLSTWITLGNLIQRIFFCFQFMKTETIYPLSLLMIKGLGRKTAFSVLKSFSMPKVNNENDFIDHILEIKGKGEIKEFPEFDRSVIISSIEKAKSIIDQSEKEKIKVISYWDSEYPEQLKRTDDPPLILNYKGDIGITRSHIGIAVIGTREPSEAGFLAGEFYGEYLSKLNYNIVSGLAKGCDTSGHKGALKGNGRTTAILAHGLQMIHPEENKGLASQILESGGLILSEYMYGTETSRKFFIHRNRLQSGLSAGTIVVQTDIKGGTMHAVKETIKSSKPLAAVTYIEEDPMFDKIQGNQMLIEKESAFPLNPNNISEFLSLIIGNNKSH
jgi:DNA processing protein